MLGACLHTGCAHGANTWCRGWAAPIGRILLATGHAREGGVRGRGHVTDRASQFLSAVRNRACVDTWARNLMGQPRPGWAPDPPMVGIRSPIGLVVGSCTSHPGVLGSIPKREEPGKTGAPCVKVENANVGNVRVFENGGLCLLR